MCRLRVNLPVLSCVLLWAIAAWADPAQEEHRAEKEAVKANKEIAAVSQAAASASQATASVSQEAADVKKQDRTVLNLQLPSDLDMTGTALTLEERTEALPDLFAHKTADERVTLDGSLLVEEDLELNPGAGLDNGDQKDRDAGQDETDFLDGVEGAQLNIRMKVD